MQVYHGTASGSTRSSHLIQDVRIQSQAPGKDIFSVDTPSQKGQRPPPHPKAEEGSRPIHPVLASHPQSRGPSLVMSGTLKTVDFSQQVGFP